MRIKFIHIADFHLGKAFTNASFPRDIAKERRQEQWETFGNIIEMANKHTIDFLLISGDLFEKDYITMGEIKRVNQYFEQIPHVEIVIIAGNHDPYGFNPFYYDYPWSENVHVIKGEGVSLIEFKEKDTAVYGYSWRNEYITEDIHREDIPETTCKERILLLHGDAHNKNSNYLPIDTNKLKELPFRYIALGHIHRPEAINNHIRYSGSPEPLDFGETGQHGVIFGEFDEDILKAEFVPMAKREFVIYELELNPEMDYQLIADSILSLPEKERNLFRIIVKGMVDSDISLGDLMEEIKGNFYHLEWIDNSVPDYNLEKISLENNNNIIGAFIKEMEKKDVEDTIVKDALYIGLEALLKERNF